MTLIAAMGNHYKTTANDRNDTNAGGRRGQTVDITVGFDDDAGDEMNPAQPDLRRS